MINFLTGFRKFAMGIIFLVVAVGLLLAGVIPADDWLKNVTAVVTAFMATNVGEHIINAAKHWIEQKNQKDIAEVMKEHNNGK